MENTASRTVRTSWELFPSVLSASNTNLLTVCQRCHPFSRRCGLFSLPEMPSLTAAGRFLLHAPSDGNPSPTS